MKLFNFRKKKSLNSTINDNSLEDIAKTLATNTVISVPKDNCHNTFGDSLDKLIDGDLPWGWVYHNRDFTEPIEKEYKYFLDKWINARTSSTAELRSALKSFVLYMEDVEKLCKSKGECFEFWFNEILTGKGYLKQRKDELQFLESHYNELVSLDNKRNNLSSDLWNFLLEHNGILQKDIYKKFDLALKDDIQSLLYKWDKEMKIKREKSGNTYRITL